MKTLAGSYFMCSPYKYTENDAGTLSFLGHQKHFRLRVSLAVSSQIKHFHTISAASSALPSADTQTADEIVKLQEIDIDQPKTVHVRFKLQKECAFGEQFLIVGDDPIIGSWEPSDGVPLNWCDGHVWTAELDIPSGKVIKYKFLLKGENGIISWQSGPDRSFETWDTKKMITVFEDWDDPELQNIVESDLNEEILANSDLLIVDENLSQKVTDEETNVEKELVDTNGFTNIAAEKPYALLVAENIVESVIDKKKEVTGEFENRLVIPSNIVSSEKEMVLVSDEGALVLVPGLIPMAPEEEETMEREHAENTSIASDEVEESSVPELKEADNVSNSFQHPTINIEEIDKKSQVNDDKGQLENSVLEGDKQWGRQTLQKFLASLGFQLFQ